MSGRSDHFDGRRFFNPGGANGQPVWKVPRMLLERRTPWPDVVPVRPVRPPRPQPDGEIVVTFIGHSTFLIQTPAANVLTDPVYSQRASPFTFAGPRRARQPGVAFDDLPDISVVLVSHNHYDHCDLRTLGALERRFHPLVITPLNNAPLLGSAGMRRIEAIDWWQPAAAAPLPILATPAQHFSARGPFDRNRALWSGFVMVAGDRRILFAGDTGYGSHFGAIRERLGPIDIALLPIGAYEPRWFMKDIHMSPAEAAQAHLDLAAKRSIAMHFGTFQLTPEGIDAPIAALEEALHARHIAREAFRTIECGESVRVASGFGAVGDEDGESGENGSCRRSNEGNE